MIKSHYRLHDLSSRLDRDKTTIIRWEKQGLVPRAKRDSRGWRYYTIEDVNRIVQLVEGSDYFQDLSKVSLPRSRAMSPVMLSVAAGVAVMLVSLIGISGPGVRAFTNQTTTFFTTVSAGILDVVSATSSLSFTGVSVSFSSQTSTSQAVSGKNDMGAFRVSDLRGSEAGWTVNLTGNDWKSGQDVMQLDYNGTGSNNNLGKMCFIPTSGAIRSQAGADTTNVTLGALDCFSASVATIDLITASSGYGNGDYWVTDLYLTQYIPSNPTAQSLTTTIVLTIS